MGFGGSSLSYCAAPFLAPLTATATATATATTPTAASSSSTLSPLAPPFTVDRKAPRPALNYDPYVPAWPPRSQPSEDCLHHHRPPSPSPPPASPPRSPHRATTTAAAAAAAADAIPCYAHGPGLFRASSGEASSWRNPSLSRADSYYTCLGSAAATSTRDAPAFYGARREGLGRGSGYLGRHSALSDVKSVSGAQAEGVGGSSAWIERGDMAIAPGYGAAFQKDASIAPGFAAYEDLQGGWRRKLTESPSEKDQFRYEHLDWLDVGNNAGVPSNMSGTSAFGPGGPVGVHYPHSSDMQTFVEGSETSDFNSSYDRYSHQSNPDITDPKAFYPATTYFPANALALNSSTNTSMEKCSIKDVNHVQHVNAFKNDILHRRHVSIRPAEPSIDLNFKCKEDYDAMTRGNDMGKIDNANVNTSVVKITLPPSTESAKQISQDCSLGKKTELRITSFNNPGSVECDHEQSSSERLDENLAEDSPCWKGAPSFRRSVSSTFDTLVADYAIADKRSDAPHKNGSDYPKAENEDVTLHSHGLRKDRNIVMPSKDHRDDFGSKIENVAQVVNEEKHSTSVKNDLITGIAKLCTDPLQSDSSTFCSLASNGQLSLSSKAMSDTANGSTAITDPSIRNSTLGIDAQVLVKTVHNLSELLSSSCRSDATLLKEHDIELLCSAVNNLYTCISRKPESEGMSSNVFCHSGSYSHRQISALYEDVPKASGQAKGTESIDGSMEQSNNRSNCHEKEKMHSISSNLGSDELDNFLSACGDRNLQKLSGKVMNVKIYEQGENPQAALYENLWSDVEDAVSLLSCRLQLLRSNIFKGNHRRQLTKDSELEVSKVLKLSNQNEKNDIIGESTSPWKSTDSPSKNSSAQGKHENVTNLQEPQRMIGNSFQKQQQMMGNNIQNPPQTFSSSIDSKVDDVDASVMARFKVIKCRIEKLESADVEEQIGKLNSLNIVNNSGTHENICSPPCLSHVNVYSGVEFHPTNDAMPSGCGYQLSFCTGRTAGEVSGSSNVQYDVADYTKGLCLASHFSERMTTGGFCGQGASGLASQAHVPDSRSGKHFITSVHDGSSDWEHVLEEELTW